MGRNGRRINMQGSNDTYLSIYSSIETAAQWLHITEMQLLYAVMLLIGLIACMVLTLSRRKSKKLATQLEKLQKDLMVANSTTIGMGQKLIHLEKQLQTNLNQHQYPKQEYSKQKSAVKPPLDSVRSGMQSESIVVEHAFVESVNGLNNHQQKTETPKKLSLVNSDFLQSEQLPSDEAYEKSRQLISQGLDIPEIVKQSGLSFSEVSLMKKLAK